MGRFKAESHQYLQIHHRDGRIEHIRGPSQIYENPALHDNVLVKDAIHLDSPQKCIIVYRETTAIATATATANEASEKESKCADEKNEKQSHKKASESMSSSHIPVSQDSEGDIS